MKEEIKELLHKSQRSIDVSAKMIGDKHYDFAVSRAYYAIFYAAEALLLSKELAFSKHSAVVAAFGEHFVKTSLLPAQMHSDFRLAFDKRAKGDYSLEKVSKEEALDIKEKASDFVDKVKDCLQKG